MASCNLPKLSDEEMDMCRKAFLMFDKDGSGTINIKELGTALYALGQKPTDDELFIMMTQVDQDGSKEIDLSEFMQAIQLNKSMSEKTSSEADTVDAFVALGGCNDKTGRVLVTKLTSVLQDFELNVDMDSFIGEDGKQELEYEEFRQLLE